jgi:hypothetical protein
MSALKGSAPNTYHIRITPSLKVIFKTHLNIILRGGFIVKLMKLKFQSPFQGSDRNPK